jgi:hypothetical protein
MTGMGWKKDAEPLTFVKLKLVKLTGNSNTTLVVGGNTGFNPKKK